MTVAFNEKNTDGGQIVIETPVKDQLTSILADKSAPAERRERAADVLSYYNAVANKPVPSELDRAGQLLLAESDAGCLWNYPEKYRVDPVKGLVIVDTPVVTTPTPYIGQRDATITSQTFEPAVPLPVRPVEDHEKQVVAGLLLDPRFSPANVSRRLAEIELEAQELRRLRQEI